MIDQARRGVFSSLSCRKGAIRPPYGSDESLFHQECPTCETKACGTVCEEALFDFGEDGTPSLRFKDSGCTFCVACAHACPLGVLRSENEARIKASVQIDTATCLAWNEVMCFTCKDACDDKAITFFGLMRPVVESASCTACGFCVAPCPVDAIVVKRRE
jgi:ferredoxin-type protein NapF